MGIEQTYKALLESANDMVLIHDSNGDIIYINPSGKKELGITSNEDSYNCKDFILEGSKALDDESITGPTYDKVAHEFMVYRCNKTCFHGSIYGISTGDSEAPYATVIKNLSIEKSLEKQIKSVSQKVSQAEEVKSEFVSNVTHELRTPVNAVLGYTRQLLEIETDDNKLDTLHTIERSCNDMNNLINSILDFSKLEAGKFTLENREFNFRDMIDHVKKTHIPKIVDKGLDFIVKVSPEIPETMIGDELRIGQILNNLLSNAAKFTHTGRISLEVLKTNYKSGRMEISFIVMDTGIGIKKEDLDKLFKSFSQVDASISRQYGGTGLGLNISRQLAELMGGSINVDSEYGKGTMFSVTVWLDTDATVSASDKMDVLDLAQKRNELEDSGMDALKTFGSPENLAELNKLLDKLILCIDMGNWEKAEQFSVSIKDLTATAPKEIKTEALRMKMSVQKEDVDKARTSCEFIKNNLEA